MMERARVCCERAMMFALDAPCFLFCPSNEVVWHVVQDRVRQVTNEIMEQLQQNLDEARALRAEIYGEEESDGPSEVEEGEVEEPETGEGIGEPPLLAPPVPPPPLLLPLTPLHLAATHLLLDSLPPLAAPPFPLPPGPAPIAPILAEPIPTSTPPSAPSDLLPNPPM